MAAMPMNPNSPPVTQPVYKQPKSDELMARMTQIESQGLNQQKSIEADLQERLKALQGQDLPVDLTPLAQLTDTWTGSKFAQSYTPPETLRERKNTIKGLQNEIKEAKGLYTDQQYKYLKSQLDYSLKKEDFEYQRQKDAQELALKRAALAASRAKSGGNSGFGGTGVKDASEAFEIKNKVAKTKDAELAQGLTRYTTALGKYEKLVSKYGTSFSGKDAADLKNAYSDLTVEFKNAAGLGALSGPDVEILKSSIPEAGGFDGFMTDLGRGGKDGILSAIRAGRETATRNYMEARENLRGMTQGLEPVVNPLFESYDANFRKAAGIKEPGLPPAGTQTNQQNALPAEIEQEGIIYQYNPKTGKYE